jgi:hypothetical protein
MFLKQFAQVANIYYSFIYGYANVINPYIKACILKNSLYMPKNKEVYYVDVMAGGFHFIKSIAVRNNSQNIAYYTPSALS